MKLENKKPKQRTITQNKSLHLYFTQLAEVLNDAGLDMRVILKPEVEIPWTSENVKNHLWRPIQRAYLQKESTTELTTQDIDKIYDIFNRHISKFGVFVEFPSIETLENNA